MPSDPSQLLLSVVFLDLLLAVLTVGFFWVGVSVMRGLGRQRSYSLAPLGFRKPESGYSSGVLLGFLTGLGALAASLLAIAPLSFYVLERFGYSTERSVQGPLMRGLAAWIGENPVVGIPATVAVVVFFGPAVEELIFRGALFGGLYRLGLFVSRKLGGKDHRERKEIGERVSFALSASFSSVVFALAHGEAVIVPVLFVLAFVLCALYRRTGSLLPCLATHATFNAFAVLLVILSGFGVLPTPA
ncbi:MAG: CPBP family intramembrane metalloprotease [Actinomycetota bacterium]|nr:CPBP family intramembrane metalloprotease [Actinomycetota bacterium]